jgi:hypothetical protein
MKTTYRVRNDRVMHAAAARVHDELDAWTRHTNFVTRWAALIFCALVVTGFVAAVAMGGYK